MLHFLACLSKYERVIASKALVLGYSSRLNGSHVEKGQKQRAHLAIV